MCETVKVERGKSEFVQRRKGVMSVRVKFEFGGERNCVYIR